MIELTSLLKAGCDTRLNGSPHIHECTVKGSRGVVANILDCDIVVSDFKLQSRYNVPFWANTLKKGMNLFISLQLWVK